MSAIVETHVLELRAGMARLWTVECWTCGLTVMEGGRATYANLKEAESARDRHNTETHALIARLERREYSGGRAFWLVRCDKCSRMLNSGHHYNGHELEHAQRLADEHNAEVHGLGAPLATGVGR